MDAGIRVRKLAGGATQSIYRRTFVIGSGYFTVALVEPLYSAYVPLMLADHLRTSVAVGSTLSALNLIAPLVIPVFAAWSDKTVTTIGRRMPFIVVLLPLAALSLAVVPVGARLHLGVLIVALGATNLFRHAARGPVVSLMPDLVPSAQRSQANGVINTMGGFAAITATVLLAPLITVELNLPIVGPTRRVLPFWIIAVLMIAATVFLYRNVTEPYALSPDRDESPVDSHESGAARKDGPLTLISEAMRSGRDEVLPILAAVALWFLAWKLLTPFITIYARDVLGAGEATAGLSFGMLAVAQTAFAIPSGIAAARWGRRRVMKAALTVLVLVGLAALGNHMLAGRPGGAGLFPFWVLLFVLGLGWVVLVTNCLPLLWDIGGASSVGLYTGLYYFASQTALVAGPSVGGLLVQIAGFGGLFAGFSVVMVLALLLVRRGERRAVRV